ncbi:unnamed protein product [Symbiodinium natans]|uniref:Uncharacterized protein n=1 Tax=Symbiodinium natans TaxID=878477 RepID=A0A812MED5_9DINO|nr:unnamed protein product [Symbiodinium natans]
MGCCKKGCCSPKVQAIVGLCAAPLNLTILIWGITEKVRWTPFYVPMECTTPPPDGLRLSGLSMPSPLAEGRGLLPGSPPYGLYVNKTVTTACTNPGQAKMTTLAAGFEVVELAPNATDMASGGVGLPYSQSGTSRLAGDAVYPIGGRGEMVMEVATARVLDDVLAVLAPEATARGYSVTYSRMTQTVQTCASVMGMESCNDQVSEQFCGSYEGDCLVPKLDSSGAPLVPEQLESAICPYTGKLCGNEAEVHAQLNAAAMGIQVVSRPECAPSLGLPNGTLCNVIEAPGLDSATKRPRAIETAMSLTTEAEARMTEALAAAESAVTTMIWITIVCNSIFFLLNLSSGLFNLRKHLRANAPKASSQGAAPPTLATNAFDTKP